MLMELQVVTDYTASQKYLDCISVIDARSIIQIFSRRDAKMC